MKTVRRTIFLVVLTFSAFACGSGKKEGIEEGKIRPVAYSEGDTLELGNFPPDLGEWIAFYHRRFPEFRIGAFHASGVVLHLDDLAPSTSPEPPDSLQASLAWSKDGKYYVDFGEPGDIDQEVILGRSGKSDRRLVMFNGPSDLVETADWLSNDVFILSRMSIDSVVGWMPSIYLFSLKDSTFTDLRWERTIPSDSMLGLGEGFQLIRKARTK